MCVTLWVAYFFIFIILYIIYKYIYIYNNIYIQYIIYYRYKAKNRYASKLRVAFWLKIHPIAYCRVDFGRNSQPATLQLSLFGIHRQTPSRLRQNAFALSVFLLFPMKRFKGGRFVLPRRFSHGIDDKRSRYHYDASNHQDRIPHRIAAHRNLSGRDEAENESQQGAQEAHSGYQPHQAVALASDAERTFCLLHIITQIDGCRKHHQVHNEVKQYR